MHSDAMREKKLRYFTPLMRIYVYRRKRIWIEQFIQENLPSIKDVADVEGELRVLAG